MFLSPVKCVGFPHVWLCWHGNRNGIVMCVLNFSPLSPELHSEESLTLSPPPSNYTKEEGWGQILSWFQSQNMYVKTPLLSISNLCESGPSLWSNKTFECASVCVISVKLFSCSTAFDWKLYSCMNDKVLQMILISFRQFSKCYLHTKSPHKDK